MFERVDFKEKQNKKAKPSHQVHIKKQVTVALKTIQAQFICIATLYIFR